MDEFKEDLEKVDILDLYEAYLKIESLIEELNKNIKQLPPKEEL